MNKNRLGALQVALGAICWSFAGVLSKSLPWNALTTNGMRSLIAAALLALARGTWKVRFTKGTLLGAAGVALTSILYMAATKRTTSANAIVLQYAMPVFVILFFWLFYHQRPSAKHIIIAGFILAGVVLCSWDGLTGGNPLGDTFAILSAVTFALVFFCARMPGANPQDYSFLGMIFCAPFSLCGFVDPGMSLNPVHWLIALGLGLCLAGGYFFISKSMSNVSPISAALLANLEPILNPIWVFLFLGERPGTLTLIGAAIVLVTATVYSLLPAEDGDL
ncbi:MAG: EamA family transporter [Clostridia bacterium]|nr:EamA family transporter [Clostridia bacterium]